VRAAQRRRLGHHRAADSCSPLSSPPQPSQSRRAVATWRPAPQRGKSELLTTHPTRPASEGLHGMRMTRRALAAVSPPSPTVRDPGRPAKQRASVLTPNGTVSRPLQTFASPPVRRPSRTGARGGAIFGALSVDSRAVDPQATAPGLRQPAPAARPARRRSSQARPRARTWWTRRHEVDSRRPRTAPGSNQAPGQHGDAESASPGAGPSDLPGGRDASPRMSRSDDNDVSAAFAIRTGPWRSSF
jgi:hypothetical protein